MTTKLTQATAHARELKWNNRETLALTLDRAKHRGMRPKPPKNDLVALIDLTLCQVVDWGVIKDDHNVYHPKKILTYKVCAFVPLES